MKCVFFEFTVFVICYVFFFQELVLFDVLLCFALMELENCDRSVQSFFKQQISRSRHYHLEKLVISAIEYNEVCSQVKKILCFLKL